MEEIRGFSEVTLEDLAFLAIGTGTLRTGQTSEGILMGIAHGRGYLLRIAGKARGIITAQIMIHPGGREFVMHLFAGKGVFPSQFENVADSIFEFARARGCRWVRFENIHPILDRFYKRKFKRSATVFVKEISDGRQ